MTYLILFLIIFILVGSYLFIKFFLNKNNKLNIRIKDYFIKTLALLSLLFIFIATFVEPGKMIANQISQIEFSGGCISLIGIPYGDNKVANFFAWFQIFLYFPSAFILIGLVFFKFKESKNLLYFIIAPILLLNACLLFNLNNAMCNTNTLNASTSLLTIEVALITSLMIIKVIDSLFDGVKERFILKDNLLAIATFITITLLFTPSYSLAVLISPTFDIFGKSLVLQHANRLSTLHRVVIYLTILFSILYFAVFKNGSKEKKKMAVLLLAVCGINSFIISHPMSDTFIHITTYFGRVTFNFKNLPLELYNIALILMPIAIIFNKQKLFDISYFIVLPIAIISTFFPKNAYLHVFNHLGRSYLQTILSTSLLIILTSGYGLMKPSRLKKINKPILYFAGYFLVVIVLNSWLSNYVEGFKLDDLYNGRVNFLNTNSPSMVSFLGDNFVKKLFSFNFVLTGGGYKLVFYYLYHIILFFIYIFIFFAMYFVEFGFSQIGNKHIILSQKIHGFKKDKNIEKKIQKNLNNNVALEISNLTKVYKGNNFASLTNLSLKLHRGDIVGLLGHNGAGKSTLIKCVVGQEEFQNGEVKAYGVDNVLYPKQFKTLVGYIPDHYILYEDLTGREFVNYIADLYGVDKETRRKNILHYLKLFNLIASFDSKIETYSFGMKQKLAIMSTLIHEPRIWLLDEPLTGLDPQSIYQIKKSIISHAAKGNVVLFSSHLIDLVEEVSNKIVILNKGKLIYEETTDKAKSDYKGKLENLYLDKVGTGD